MSFLDTRLYRWLDVLANFFFLNILWLLACVPLITLFPATAALFAVVRDWVRGKDEGFFMPFFRYMRENFVQSLVVGLVWTVVGLVLVADFLFVREITSWVRTPFLALLILVGLVYLGTAVHLFPVMVHFQARWFHIIKNSLIIAISSPVITFLSLLILFVAGLAIFYVPLSFLLFGSVTAYLLYSLCHRLFQQIESDLEEGSQHTDH